jgi:hypothetical protein
MIPTLAEGDLLLPDHRITQWNAIDAIEAGRG